MPGQFLFLNVAKLLVYYLPRIVQDLQIAGNTQDLTPATVDCLLGSMSTVEWQRNLTFLMAPRSAVGPYRKVSIPHPGPLLLYI